MNTAQLLKEAKKGPFFKQGGTEYTTIGNIRIKNDLKVISQFERRYKEPIKQCSQPRTTSISRECIDKMEGVYYTRMYIPKTPGKFPNYDKYPPEIHPYFYVTSRTHGTFISDGYIAIYTKDLPPEKHVKRGDDWFLDSIDKMEPVNEIAEVKISDDPSLVLFDNEYCRVFGYQAKFMDKLFSIAPNGNPYVSKHGFLVWVEGMFVKGIVGKYDNDVVQKAYNKHLDLIHTF